MSCGKRRKRRALDNGLRGPAEPGLRWPVRVVPPLGGSLKCFSIGTAHQQLVSLGTSVVGQRAERDGLIFRIEEAAELGAARMHAPRWESTAP
jgi:hypothetical protein